MKSTLASGKFHWEDSKLSQGLMPLDDLFTLLTFNLSLFQLTHNYTNMCWLCLHNVQSLFAGSLSITSDFWHSLGKIAHYLYATDFSRTVRCFLYKCNSGKHQDKQLIFPFEKQFLWAFDACLLIYFGFWKEGVISHHSSGWYRTHDATQAGFEHINYFCLSLPHAEFTTLVLT